MTAYKEPISCGGHHFDPARYLRTLSERLDGYIAMSPTTRMQWEHHVLLQRLKEIDDVLRSMAASNGNATLNNWPTQEARLYRYLSASRLTLSQWVEERATKLKIAGLEVERTPDLVVRMIIKPGYKDKGFTEAQLGMTPWKQTPRGHLAAEAK